MKTMRFLLVLMISALFMVSCHKIEGDDIPEIGKTLRYSVDSAGVLTVNSNSSFGVLIDSLKLYYVEDRAQDVYSRIDADSVLLTNLFVKADDTPVATLWNLKPNAKYKYFVVYNDFTQILPIVTNDEIEWDSVQIMNPENPEVKADSAKIADDTLWLYGTVKSHWRPLMDERGLTRDLKFVWGAESLNDTLVAEVVKDTLMDSKLSVNILGAIPVDDLQGAGMIIYKAYAKNAWGNGENYSDPRTVSISSSGKAE